MRLPTADVDNGETRENDRLAIISSYSIQPKLFGKPDWLSEESYSLLLLVFSAMFYSIMAAYIKFATATGIPSTQLVFMRAVFQGFLVVLAMMWFRDTDSTETKGQLLIWLPFGAPKVRNVVLARGFVGGFGFLLYYYTISVLPLGDATTLMSLNPVLTVIAAYAFLGEPIRISHTVAALGSVIGCLLIAKPSFLFDRKHTTVPDPNKPISLGYITALMGACCGATVYILIRRAGKGGVHTLQLLFAWVTFGIFFSLLVGVVIPVLSGQESPFIWPTSIQSWKYVLGVSIFGSIGHFLMNYAGRHAPAGLASIMRSSGIMWSYGLELIVFHQIPQNLTIWGVVLIILSLATVAVEKHQQGPSTRYMAVSKDSSSFLDEVEPNIQMESAKRRPTKCAYGSMTV